MNLTANRLIAASGICAAVAGAIFIGVQINHPPADVQHVMTADVFVREAAKATMAVLALVGLAGLFARCHRRFGVAGLVGYVLISLGYLAMFAVQCIVGFVLPTVAKTDPAYVQDFIDAAMGKTPVGDIGSMSVLFSVMGLGFAVGGLLFGIALYRSRLVSRWASALFAASTIAVLALKVLPESFSRPFAVPTGIALIGLGVSLWRDQRTQTETIDAPATTVTAPAAVPAAR
jgi:hypothetical protein